MPLKPHPTDPDKLVFVPNEHDLPWLEAPINVTEEPMRTWLWDRNYSVIDTDDLQKLIDKKWQPLTDEEIYEAIEASESVLVLEMARAIEARLKEKNA